MHARLPSYAEPASPALGGTLAPPLQLPSLSIDPFRPSAPLRHWTSIVLHHTASAQGSVESINAAHLRRKDQAGNAWLGIGYHFVIGNGRGMGDGEIEPTFRWREQLHGAHAGDDDYNQHGIGIVLVGNFEEGPPTPAQLASVRRLVAILRTRYGIDKSRVIRHGDIKATACPGKYFSIAEITQQPGDLRLGAAPRESAPRGPIRLAAQERTRP
jgi:hypothetical protein